MARRAGRRVLRRGSYRWLDWNGTVEWTSVDPFQYRTAPSLRDRRGSTLPFLECLPLDPFLCVLARYWSFCSFVNPQQGFFSRSMT